MAVKASARIAAAAKPNLLGIRVPAESESAGERRLPGRESIRRALRNRDQGDDLLLAEASALVLGGAIRVGAVVVRADRRRHLHSQCVVAGVPEVVATEIPSNRRWALDACASEEWAKCFS